MMLGSTSRALLRSAPCPVLVVQAGNGCSRAYAWPADGGIVWR
ncbi:universal stress protein [Saccharopolyspora sp. NPDC050389]